jgi:hypothetical protein
MGKKITTAAKGAVPNVRLIKAHFVQLPKICTCPLNIEVNRALILTPPPLKQILDEQTTSENADDRVCRKIHFQKGAIVCKYDEKTHNLHTVIVASDETKKGMGGRGKRGG